MCGVYYLLGDNLEVIYIGSSRNVQARLANHRSRRMPFDLFCYDECEESALLEKEAAAIKLFRPKLNVNMPLSH